MSVAKAERAASLKFQDEVGGHLQGGDPGIRLIEPASGAPARYADAIPSLRNPHVVALVGVEPSLGEELPESLILRGEVGHNPDPRSSRAFFSTVFEKEPRLVRRKCRARVDLRGELWVSTII